MRTLKRVLLTGSAAALAFGAWSGSARAQLDIDPPLPNVLLLVDTSGTMEYLIKPDPATGANVLPGAVPGSECDPTKPAATTQNRWASLVSVLTGTINGFSCQATQRSTPEFKTEFGLGVSGPANASWLAPYDWAYYLPFNRMYSNGCTAGPGVQSPNWWDWPVGTIHYHDQFGDACAQPWSQKPDGLLDTFRDRVRFAMMTFDTLPDESTGVVSSGRDYPSGMKGMWSYYPSWNPAGSGYAQGYPPNCASAPFEVGARGPAAPPWEGRLIPFGAWDAALTGVHETNDHIQEALISMRPYGATPISGLFDDATTFLMKDTDIDQNTTKSFGPRDDKYVLGGCRKQYIIFLTDGANGPDFDLRPSCNQVGGVCPYQPATTTAQALANLPPGSEVETFVVGFAVSNPTALSTVIPGLTSCAQLDQSNLTACANPPAALVPCCNLSKLAIAGGTDHAYFADDPVALQQVLSEILGGITSSSTARTIPVFSSVGSSNAQGPGAEAAGYRFVAKFTTDGSGHLWRGQLQRERLKCNAAQVSDPVALDSTKGDDFSDNVDFDDPNHPRQFWSFIAPKVGTKVASDSTIRPAIVNDDGMGLYAQGTSGMLPATASAFVSTMSSTSEALAIDPTAPPAACTSAFSTTSGATCADKLLQWEIGTSPWPKTRNKAVCAANGAVCSKFGSVYHSTPAISTAPRELLRDDSYTAYATQQAKRPLMIYTATTDGQLHAFKISAGDPADPFKINELVNNELWSFFPPTVLPNLLGSYDRQAVLLDGAPVIADVAGKVVSGALPPVYERSQGAAVQWSSVLVAGGGLAGGFYYALDITKPSEPRFLWQLSKDASGTSLFGDTTSTPAITTLALADSGGGVKEVAVAILPGGSSGTLPSSCTTQYATATNPNTNKLLTLMTDSTYHERTSVRCWKPGGGRSLTIVRLDNGEVLMSFRAGTTDGPAGLLTQNPVRAQLVPMASPITGVPAAFPGQTGQIANRIYVGDADGVLWRADVSGRDPTKWTMSIAWDSYSVAGDTALVGEVMQTPPVISTNPIGDTVILFSTGDQEQLTSNTTMVNRVWSIQEKRNAFTNSFETSANWYRPFPGGERVTGPMGIFDSVAYFSTFAPTAPGGAVCSFGVSKIWALDYQTAAPRFPNGNSAPIEFDTAPDTIIAGVAVTKTPSCDTVTPVSDDPYLGTHSAVSEAGGGLYQLVWQKGPGAGSTNPAVKTDPAGIQSMDLQSPRQSTRIDSWATIIE